MPDLRLTDPKTEGTNAGAARGKTAASSQPHPHEHSHQHDDDREDHHDHDEGWLEWARVAFVAVILVLAWARVVPRVSGIDILALTGVLIGQKR